ncbi:MAG: hypothetical protein AB9917_01555 [Negativicutes bacterium]
MTNSNKDFGSQITRLGVYTTALALIANFIPALYLAFGLGISPSMNDLFKIWSVAAAAFGVGWVIQVVSFFPVLGSAGSYIGWIAGSVADLRTPAVTMAQKAAKVEAGTPEGDVISTLGIATSVFVSVTIIAIFTFVGASIIPLLPRFVTKAFQFIVPAVFGAVYVELSSKDYSLGLIIFALGASVVAFAPKLGIPGWSLMAVGIVVAVLAARIKYQLTKP